MQLFLLPLATVAGIISFTSPCCLPLIPGYLSYVSALPVSELGAPQARAVTLRATLLFVGGFTVVFTALGISSAVVGAVLIRSLPLITAVALALGFQRWRGSLEWLRRHGRGIEILGGSMLVVIGVLFVSGLWRSFFLPLQRYFAQFGWPPI